MKDDSEKLLTDMTEELYDFILARLTWNEYGVLRWNVGELQEELRAFLTAAFEYGTAYQYEFRYHWEGQDGDRLPPPHRRGD